MKPYGVRIIPGPDVADIRAMGSKASVGGKNYFRSSAAKARTRRYWKRRERKQAREAIRLEAYEAA